MWGSDHTLESDLQALKLKGRKIMACFPPYPPLEIFHSLGFAPVVLWGLGGRLEKTPHSDGHLQTFACSVSRRLAEAVLSGPGRLLDGLFMYNACDTLRNMPEILERGLRAAGNQAPWFHIHVPMNGAGAAEGGAFLRSEINSLVERLEEAYDVRFSPDGFQESLRLYRRVRQQARRLEGAAADGLCRFSTYSRVMTENAFRLVEDQAAALEDCLGGLEDQAVPPEPSGRVVLSGMMPPPPEVSALIEGAGLRIVGNDIGPLARSHEGAPERDGTPADYYAAYYFGRHPCPTLLFTADRRWEHLAGLVESRRADGFIFIGEKYCEYEYFEYPYLEARLRERGVHVLALEFTLGEGLNLGQMKTRIEAFAELIGGIGD